jgi:hypothetical protein
MSAAARDQLISRNPRDGVSLPRLPDHRQRFLTRPTYKTWPITPVRTG